MKQYDYIAVMVSKVTPIFEEDMQILDNELDSNPIEYEINSFRCPYTPDVVMIVIRIRSFVLKCGKLKKEWIEALLSDIAKESHMILTLFN